MSPYQDVWTQSRVHSPCGPPLGREEPHRQAKDKREMGKKENPGDNEASKEELGIGHPSQDGWG